MRSTPIKLQSNGKYWLASWWVNGEHHTKSIGSKANFSKRAAERACAGLAREHAINPAKATAKANSQTLLEEWKQKYLALRTDLDEATAEMHATTLGYMIAHLGGGRRLDKITRADAAAFRSHLAAQPGIGLVPGTKQRVRMSDASICRHIRNAKTIVGKAIAIDLIAVNPFDKERGTPQGTDKDWTALDAETIATLIERSPTPDWQRLFGLCAYAGLRRGEALRMKWSDIDLDRRRLKVRTKAGKVTTKQSVRDVLIVAELAALLDVRATTCTSAYVTCPGVASLDRTAKKIIALAGLQPWTPPFHTLRKWRATSWREAYPEYVVDAWLGHGPEVARKHYTKVEDRYYAAGPNIHAIAATLKGLAPDQLAAILNTITPAAKAHAAAAS